MGAPIRLQTHVWNPLGERRALLLHGLTSDGTGWWQLAAGLADAGWLVIAPDLRSHGRSPAGAEHTVAAFAGDVELLGGGYDLVVGHSLGGSIAARLLATAGFASAAVLVDPVIRLEPAVHRQLRADLHAAFGKDAAAVRAEHPRWHERDVQRKVLAMGLVTPDVVDAVLDDNDPWDVTADVGAWQARVHLLVADPDEGGLLPPSVAAEVADGVRVTSELVAGAGHSIHREVPGVVRAAVDRVVG